MIKKYPTFPVAAHSYFSAINKAEACQQFMSSSSSQPMFQYGSNYSHETINYRIEQLSDESWVNSLKLVACSIKLQDDTSQTSRFRALNQGLFGTPSKHYASLILGRIGEKVTDQTVECWSELTSLIGQDTFDTFETPPSRALFDRYRNFFLRYLGDMPDTDLSVQAMLAEQLIKSGLSKDGWKVKLHEGHSPARTSHRKKSISIGAEYKTRTQRAAQRIAVHEVYGHALRGPQASVLESEGFAILLEQLSDPIFKYRRSYRYLAVALGWGVFGKPLTFREVHEVLWRVMLIGSKYSEDHAKKHAFDECYRAFRGGRPDIPGAVFLKDMTYFAANLAMWEVLSKTVISYNEFIDCIEGRRTLL